mmetsp:Transcript_5701/g.11128  ORF Transcript_5701/g.11128 Transcript_5701/m.11128 type:complete len:254 (+) Transcript_5701:106-867(+)|eukprot:CAMPEP_0196141844 /NCGR_PEP_ID=MMETSP0910-20130528/10671_1 /TAXON_ID=49265 /ORGANISM="Thalassiosira rotula, Strain GSO102" /LENGTH=253 /DNA_ID=CAMNT_0041403073 /DNA_START=62 /DNA_END=823 /DNA_ORIENTATION=-
MFNRQALITVLAVAALQNANAFVPASPHGNYQCPSRTTSLCETAESKEQDLDLTRQVIMEHIETETSTDEVAEEKPIMDIPPTPVAAAAVEPVVEAPKPKPAAAKKKVAPKKKGGVHKEGVFSPVVVAAAAVLGDDELKKIRAKMIGIHSDLIKSFVGTSDSEVGQAILRQLFNIVDTDNSGYLDKSELKVALNMLGFKWLKDKQVEQIFARADANGDLEISLEEFMVEAPKTLKLNLVKLAKNNGGDMGLLV